METFNFPMHTMRHAHPAGDAVQFGGGYRFGIKPKLPIQRRFLLKFVGLQHFLNNDQTVNQTTNPTMNIWVLDKFYKDHGMWKRFIYPHQVLGNIVVMFGRPFEMPYSVKGGSGLTEEFELELIEVPS